MGIQVELLSEHAKQLLGNGEFGLEKESLRVTASGNLAHTPHPFPGDASRDRDFCENQVEMITGVQTSTQKVYEDLKKIHCDTLRALAAQPDGPEYLWPFSNPPYVKGEDDIPIAHFTGELAPKERYREYLAAKYGKKKMLFSGIHFNFSFPEELLLEDYQHTSGYGSFQEYKNMLYLDLAGKVLEKSWLIVYLTAASPVFDGSYCDAARLGSTIVSRYSSPRCSEIGYWNQFLPVLQFESLDRYIDSIQAYVDDGQLQAPSELYYPVRLKPRGVNTLELLRERGVNHIELRMFDLNPLSDIGIDPRDLEFVYLLLVYLVLQPSKTVVASEQITAIRNMKCAALLDEEAVNIETSWNQTKNIRDAALEILDQMEETLVHHLSSERIRSCISHQRQKLLHKNARYANRIAEEYGHDYVKRGMELIKRRRLDL